MNSAFNPGLHMKKKVFLYKVHLALLLTGVSFLIIAMVRFGAGDLSDGVLMVLCSCAMFAAATEPHVLFGKLSKLGSFELEKKSTKLWLYACLAVFFVWINVKFLESL